MGEDLTPIDRFLEKVDFTSSPNGCWLWTASLDSKGYGLFYFKGRLKKAHRIAWSNFVSKIPHGMELDHVKEVCHSKACVNPDHLRVCTPKANLRYAKGWTEGEDGIWLCKYGHRITPENTIHKSNNPTIECKLCRFLRNHGRRHT